MISPMPIKLCEHGQLGPGNAPGDAGVGIPSSSRVHDSLPVALSKSSVELVTVVECQVVSREWLAPVLVYPLQDLISCSVTQPRK